MIVNNFNNKKVVDYLNTGNYRKVLLYFYHGLGDSIMFYSTCYKTLCQLYPEIQFVYATHLGQEEIFGYVDTNERNYDIVFKFGYPCSQWSDIDETKSEKCARLEIGIKLDKENYLLPKKFKTPLIAIHLNSTCNSNMNCPKEFAEKLWNQIEQEGFIPIDTHMRHCNDNKQKSIIYNFQQCRRVDNIIQPSIPKLIGLLSSCAGFAGVPSGNMPCALSIFPHQKILYMTSQFPASRLTRLPVIQINPKKGYNRNKVSEWLNNIKG